jgi:hypothetical protein
MTQASIPFGDCAMEEITWSRMARYFSPTGVVAVPWLDEVNELKLTTAGGSNREVILDTGSAGIQGFYYLNDAPMSLYPTANSSPAGTRADLVVLECKWGVGSGITAKVIPGTPGNVWPVGYFSRTGQPRPADLVREPESLWQIPIAQVNVANGATTIASTDILDMRQFVNVGTAKSSTYIIASDMASPLLRANADAVIPYGSLHAEDIINFGISEISSKYGGGTVTLSEGPFKTSGSILPLSSINLKGQGNGTKILYQIAGGYHAVIDIHNASWVTIADMLIDGGGSAFSRGSLPAMANDQCCGIIVYDSALNTIRNCVIGSCRNAGIWINTVSAGTASWGHRVEGCYISVNYMWGLYTTGSQGIYTGNQFVYNGSAGMKLAGVSGSIGASANVISGNQIGFNYQNGMEISADPGTTVYRNIISANQFNSNGQNANNVYSHLFMYGTLCKGNKVSNNNFWTEDGFASYKPQYGIYVDTTCIDNIITDNEAWYSAYSAANNIKCTRVGSSNVSPNWIRFNRSQCTAPNGSSYDA